MKKTILSIALLTSFSFSDGSVIFSKCVGCHGQNGEKGALGKPTVLIGVSAEDTEKKLLAYKDGSLNKYGMGSLMKGQVTNLSSDDIKEVSQYISTLK